LQISDFFNAIRQKRQPLITGEDGRRVTELFTAIYRSQETRGPVQFPLRS
jgi:predicted dehydrogenase